MAGIGSRGGKMIMTRTKARIDAQLRKARIVGEMFPPGSVDLDVEAGIAAALLAERLDVARASFKKSGA